VNAIAPGAVDTPLSSYSPELRAAYERRIALGRIAQPRDIAAWRSSSPRTRPAT